jgi:peptide methionine sulfoxide reductase MsrB
MYDEDYECSCGYPAFSQAELNSHVTYMTCVVGDSFEDHH